MFEIRDKNNALIFGKGWTRTMEKPHAAFPLTFHWKAAAPTNPGKKGWSVSFAPVPCPAGEYVGEEGKCMPMYCEIKTASEWASLELQVGNVTAEKNYNNNNADGVAKSYATVSFVDASATTSCGAALFIKCLENYGDFEVVGQCTESNECRNTGDYDNSEGQRVLGHGGGDCTHPNNVCCGGGHCNASTKKCETATCGEITNGGAAFASCTGSRVYDSTKAAATSPNDANCCKDSLAPTPSSSSSSSEECYKHMCMLPGENGQTIVREICDDLHAEGYGCDWIAELGECRTNPCVSKEAAQCAIDTQSWAEGRDIMQECGFTKPQCPTSDGSLIPFRTSGAPDWYTDACVCGMNAGGGSAGGQPNVCTTGTKCTVDSEGAGTCTCEPTTTHFCASWGGSTNAIKLGGCYDDTMGFLWKHKCVEGEVVAQVFNAADGNCDGTPHDPDAYPGTNAADGITNACPKTSDTLAPSPLEEEKEEEFIFSDTLDASNTIHVGVFTMIVTLLVVLGLT